MELRFESLVESPAVSGRRAIAIGNFDGLHLGHQRLLSACVGAARQQGATASVLTFDPHPAAVLSPLGPPPLVLNRRSQRRGLRNLGIQELVRLTFDRVLATVAREDFVERVLIEELSACVVIVGTGFRFGAGRLGSVETLRLSAAGRFETVEVPVFADEGGPVSSSRIRTALSRGDLEDASRGLGRPYEIEGLVVRGEQRGRALGFPTANIDLDGAVALCPGVYAADGWLDSETKPWRAAVTLGVRPTVDGNGLTLEAHFPGLDRDLYGHSIRLMFLSRMRDERRFDSVETLKAQLADDVAQALLAGPPRSDSHSFGLGG